VPSLPDASILDPNETYQWPYEHTANGPRVHEFLQEMHREVLFKREVITVGETPFTHHDFEVLVPYVLPENKELQMIFQFEQQEVDGYPQLVPADYKLSEFKAVTSRWQVGMQERGGWNSIYLENHDVARSVSRFGNDTTPEIRTLSAKLIAAMQCTLSGSLYIYQGEEIGMANLPKEWPIEEYKDIASQNYYKEELELRSKAQGTPHPDMSDIMDGLQRKARDHARNPVQWDDSMYAGFSLKPDGEPPWMRVNDDYKEWNVAKQQKNETSVLSFWKAMLAFRKKHLSCTYGIFTPYSVEDEQVYAYTKEYKNERTVVVLNFTKEQVVYEVPEEVGKLNSPVASIGNRLEGLPRINGRDIHLRPYESLAMIFHD